MTSCVATAAVDFVQWILVTRCPTPMANPYRAISSAPTVAVIVGLAAVLVAVAPARAHPTPRPAVAEVPSAPRGEGWWCWSADVVGGGTRTGCARHEDGSKPGKQALEVDIGEVAHAGGRTLAKLCPSHSANVSAGLRCTSSSVCYGLAMSRGWILPGLVLLKSTSVPRVGWVAVGLRAPAGQVPCA